MWASSAGRRSIRMATSTPPRPVGAGPPCALHGAGRGGGGAIASLAGRTVLIMEHEPRRFRDRVDYVTSPGHFPGRRRGGPATLITTLGVFVFSSGHVPAA